MDASVWLVGASVSPVVFSEWQSACLLPFMFDERLSALQFGNRLIESIGLTVPDFGAEWRATLSISDAPGLLGRALALDMSTLADRQPLLVWDGLDWLDAPDVFMTAFVRTLDGLVRLLVRARSFRRALWMPFLVSGRARTSGIARFVDVPLFDPVQRDLPQLEVQAFGHGRVWLNGEAVYLTQQPFAMLVRLADGGSLSLETIADAFFPDLVRSADRLNRLHHGLAVINQQFGFEALVRQAGRLQLGRVHLHYDVHLFERAVQRADWRRAWHLARLPYLMDMTLPWVVVRRVTLLDQLGQVAERLAEGAPLAEQRGWLRQARVQRPLDRLLAMRLAALETPPAAQAVYDDVRQRSEQMLGFVLPPFACYSVIGLAADRWWFGAYRIHHGPIAYTDIEPLANGRGGWLLRYEAGGWRRRWVAADARLWLSALDVLV